MLDLGSTRLDAAEPAAFARLPEEVAAIPAIDRRPVISRADMGARGVPYSTASGWYRDRGRTGHPEKAGRIGRTDYWFEDEWTTWLQAYRAGKIDALTEVDRSGDPDDLVDAAEAARMLRYSSRYVIHATSLPAWTGTETDRPSGWRITWWLRLVRVTAKPSFSRALTTFAPGTAGMLLGIKQETTRD